MLGSDTVKAPRRTSGLIRHLTLLDVILIVVATPAASGIVYYSVSKAAAYPGGSVWLAFLIGMLLFLPICVLVGTASAAAPRPGGMYVFVSRTLGPRVAVVASALFFFGYSLTIGVLGGIVVRLLATLFQTLAGRHANVWATVAQTLSSDEAVLLGGLLWVVFFWAISSFGLRVFRPVARLLYIVPLAGTAVVLWVFFSASPEGFAASFDSAWGSGVSAKVTELARAAGWSSPEFSWPNTFGLLLVVLWAFGGVEMAGYASGEVRSARRSMLWGYILGWVILGGLYIALSASVYSAVGPDFPGAYAYLYDNHPDKLQALLGFSPPAPSVPFYLISVLGPTALSVVLVVCLLLWFVNTMPGFFLGISRLLFALGLDGQLPASFRNYSVRWRSPTTANHATAIVAVFGVILYAYHAGSVLATIDFSIYFFVWLYGLAAIVYAFGQRSPLASVGFAGKRLAGVPILAILGALVFLEGWLFVFLTLGDLSWPARGWLLGILAVIVGGIAMQQRRVAASGIDETAIYVSMPLDAEEHVDEQHSS